jgi:peptidoglycan/LPS O-acetylase OafA/YrhL
MNLPQRSTKQASEPAIAPASPRRPPIVGVDSLRFIAALWVAFGHGAQFPFDQLVDRHAHHWLGLAAVGASSIYNGVDAVIVFFLISGLCIHYPNVGADRVDPVKFIIRRLLRVGAPLVAAIVIARVLGANFVNSLDAVLWTIYCEIAYYCLYPAVFWLSKRFSWTKILLLTLLVSLGMAVARYKLIYLQEFGLFTFVFCYPFWILGVLLAEHLPRIMETIASRRGLWLWRLGAVAHGFIAIILATHSPIQVGYIWTIPPFAIYCYFWLPRELSVLNVRHSTVLEELGLFSYSIYLTHKLTLTTIVAPLTGLEPVLAWAIKLVLIIGLAYGFYLAVERPSHRLAKKIGARRPAPKLEPAIEA